MVGDSPRFVAALMNRSEEDELSYTTDMINTNFSNYSAWHNRRFVDLSLEVVEINLSLAPMLVVCIEQTGVFAILFLLSCFCKRTYTCSSSSRNTLLSYQN